ncbi:MAG: redoxin family protein [Pseudomonadota bacterium]
MRQFALPLFLTLLLGLTLFAREHIAFGQQLDPDAAPVLPMFPATAEDWINGKPVTNADLTGQVTLVHIWAFECWNCYRSFPWLNGLEAEIADERFGIVGVHTPEFDREKNRQAVAERARHFQLKHPSMIDNDWGYWKALNNRYWPAWYLVDGSGRIRSLFVGETHAGDPQARRIAREIRALLEESTG